MATPKRTNGFDKKKLDQFVGDWRTAESEFDDAVEALREKKKKKIKNVLDAGFAAGINPTVMRAHVKMDEYVGKANDLRHRFDGSPDLQDQFDRVVIASKVTDKLFDMDEIDKANEERAKKAASEPKKPPGKVVKFADRSTAHIEKLKKNLGVTPKADAEAPPPEPPADA